MVISKVFAVGVYVERNRRADYVFDVMVGLVVGVNWQSVKVPHERAVLATVIPIYKTSVLSIGSVIQVI